MKSTDFIKENYDHNEYNDEAGMVKNDIHTIVRVMTHLCRELKDNENMPEWVQEKIATAKGMLVGVMDYMISQHEQGIQPTVDQEPNGMAVAEDASGGGTSAGGIATSMGGMAKRSQVGSLFGGTYQQPKKSKAKKK